MRFFPEDLFGFFLNLGHSGHAADENDFVDLGFGHAGILDAGIAGRNRAVDQRIAEFFQLCSGERRLKVKRSALVHGDERQIDVGAHAGGKFAFRFFSGFLQTLERLGIVAEIDSVFLLELFREPVDDDAVEVIAAEMGVAVGGLYFEYAVADFQNGDIERSPPSLDPDDFIFLFPCRKPERLVGSDDAV